MIRKKSSRIDAFYRVCAAQNSNVVQVATESYLRTIRLLAGVCPPFPGWLRAGQSNLFGPDFLVKSAHLTDRLSRPAPIRRDPPSRILQLTWFQGVDGNNG